MRDPDALAGDDLAQLAERIRQGDPAAENRLVRHFHGRVLAMALVRTRDREAARELANDVLMAAIEALRRGSVHDTARLGAFIHGIAVNLVNNHLRALIRRPRGEPLGEDLAGPDEGRRLERDSDRALVQRLIAELPERDRRILTLTLVDGLRSGEIAARMGLAHDVVRQAKSRAIRRLQEMLRTLSRSPSGGPQGTG